MWFTKYTPVTKAREELEDNERERYTLTKNMMHDQFRLAFINARTEELRREFPELRPAEKPAEDTPRPDRYVVGVNLPGVRS